MTWPWCRSKSPDVQDADAVSALAAAHWRGAWAKPSYRIGYRWGTDAKADARATWVAALSIFGDGRSVLELGTGQGRTLRAIRDRHAGVTGFGLDLCHEALQAGRIEHGFHAVEADLARPLPIQAHAVDLVVTVGLLCHLHPDPQARLVAEVVRVARSGAVFVEQYGPGQLLKGPRAWHPVIRDTGDYLLWGVDPERVLCGLRGAARRGVWSARYALPEALRSVGATHALVAEW